MKEGKEKAQCLIGGTGKITELGSVSWGQLVPGTSDLHGFHSCYWVLSTSHTGVIHQSVCRKNPEVFLYFFKIEIDQLDLPKNINVSDSSDLVLSCVSRYSQVLASTRIPRNRWVVEAVDSQQLVCTRFNTGSFQTVKNYFNVIYWNL